MHHYLSLQFSAIQKTILRHDRLWAMAGTSQLLSHLNEIALPQIAGVKGGEVIVAGGGKFTARFASKDDAEDAKAEIVKKISTTLTMLEFQVTPVREGSSFKDIKDATVKEDQVVPGMLNILNDQKRTYRGYGITFNPHIRLCDECAQYPATRKHPAEEGTRLCRFCYDAFKRARLDLSTLRGRNNLTTLEKVYKRYLEVLNVDDSDLSIPMNFQDLFPDESEKHRLAVWVSDLNNMNTKVPIWLSQEEDRILETFKKVLDINTDIISHALASTFRPDTFIRKNGNTFLPFRLIVAGGDDLCVVMPAERVIEFALNLDAETTRAINSLSSNHPLHHEYLAKHGKGETGPYCYGGAFLVTDVHTPFKKVHETAEALMKEAKEKTGRKANSVNWKVLSTEGISSTEKLLRFDRPLVYQDFRRYIELCGKFKGISSSRVYQLSEMLMDHFSVGEDIERQALSIPETWKEDSHMNRLMKEDAFRNGNGKIVPERLATFLELLTLSREVSE